MHFELDLRKVALPGLRTSSQKQLFGSFGGLAGASKSTKNGPAGDQVRPDAVCQPFFWTSRAEVDFPTDSGSVLGPPDLNESMYIVYFRHILAFSKKHRKITLPGPVLETPNGRFFRYFGKMETKTEKQYVFGLSVF